METRLLFLLVLSPGLAWGGSYPSVREFGDPLPFGSARRLALGTAGLARGEDALAFLANPAALGGLNGRAFALSGGSSLRTEEAAEAGQARFQNSGSWSFHGLAAAAPLAGGRLRAGLAAAPAYDFRYEGSFAFPAAGGVPSSEELRTAGALWIFTAGLSLRLSNISLGLAYDFCRGRERLSASRSGPGAGPAWQERASYAGGSPRLGLRLRAGRRLGIGAAWRPAVRLARPFTLRADDGSRVRAARDHTRLPGQWGAGFSYRAAGDVELLAEARRTGWSGTGSAKPLFQELEASAPSFFGASPPVRRRRDVTELALGVDQPLSPPWRLRYGLHYLPSFSERSETTSFSVGVGRRGPLGLSLAAVFGKRDTLGDGVFLPAGRRVDETFRGLAFSLEGGW